jgi:hypothetical protein
MSERIWPGSCADSCRQYIRGFDGELFDVTRLNRPDPNWRHVDGRGHVHVWYDGDAPATTYSPSREYRLPTLVQIVDAEGSDEYPAVTHYECAACRSLEAING